MLLAKRDWKGALDNLREIYDLDSSKYSRNESAKLVLLNEQYKQNEKDQINQRIIEQNRYARTLFIASTIVAALLAVVIFLLVNNVNRKAKVNKHLTELNEQISEQKENLNQINHHLEEIIDERTKDLQVKNKKLADYSLHLSHQIRGPIATLKGLLNLERDKLIEQEECIKLMNKCVSDIDENIIDMSGMLHESSKTIVKPKA
jgi:signal transduction histidine kinase